MLAEACVIAMETAVRPELNFETGPETNFGILLIE